MVDTLDQDVGDDESSPSVLLELVDRYLVAVNTEDWASLESLFAPDARLRAVGTRERRGRADVMTYYTSLFAPWAQHDDRVTRALPSGATVTVEIAFHGITTHGRRVEFDAVDLLDTADGMITSLSSWYDLAAVRREVSGHSRPEYHGRTAR